MAIKALTSSGARLAVDVQGFVRVDCEGAVTYESESADEVPEHCAELVSTGNRLG